MKDGRTEPLGVAQLLELLSRRWGSFAVDFIAHLPLTNKVFNTITTFVDRMTKQTHLAASRATNSAEEVAKAFFIPSSGFTACLTTRFQIETQNLLSDFGSS